MNIKVSPYLFIVLLLFAGTVVASESKHNDLKSFFETADKYFQTKNIEKAKLLFSKDFTYTCYFPTVNPEPVTDSLDYDQYITDLESFFRSNAIIKSYKNNIVSIEKHEKHFEVKAKVLSVVKFGEKTNDCVISTTYHVNQISSSFEVTSFNGIAECYSYHE